MAQCSKEIWFGRLLTLYCQEEAGHKGNHVPPPMSWVELLGLGGEEHDGELARAAPQTETEGYDRCRTCAHATFSGSGLPIECRYGYGTLWDGVCDHYTKRATLEGAR